MSWSNEKTFEFLKIYRHEPCLWDPKHPLHKNKNAVSDAWFRIQKTFSISISIEDLKKKKESLMTMFRYHHKRKVASIKAGVDPSRVYFTNWSPYNEMESFLSPIYQSKRITTTEVLGPKAISQQFDSEDPNDDSNTPTTSSPRQLLSNVKKGFPERITATTQTNEVFSTFETITGDLKRNHEPDECDLYTQLLAKRLRKLDENVRDSIMHEIDDIVYKAKQRLTQ